MNDMDMDLLMLLMLFDPWGVVGFLMGFGGWLS
jgi:hypothetical protein